MTLEQVLAAVRLDMERRGLMESSIVKREICLKAFQRWLQRRPILNASRDEIERFLDQRRTRSGAPIGSRTRFTWLANLASFYRWAVSEGLIGEDPTEKIIRPKMRRSLPRPAPTDILRRLIEHSSAKERCWVLLAAFQGLRCKEIAGLRREDVLEHDGLLRVLGKGNNERMVPMHPDVTAGLLALPLPRSGFVFTRARGGRYSANALSAYFNEFLRNHDAGVTAHQLRHWFGTQLYQSTHDLRLTQDMMGHSDPGTTAVYTAFNRRDAAAAIRDLTFGGTEPDEAA